MKSKNMNGNNTGRKKGKILLKLLICLLICITLSFSLNTVSVSASASAFHPYNNRYIILSFDDAANRFIDFKLIAENAYYLNADKTYFYFGEQDDYDEYSAYSYNLFDKNNNMIEERSNIISTLRIDFNKNINFIIIYKNNAPIIKQGFNFCNSNNICESCDEANCIVAPAIAPVIENYLTCPSDCNSGAKDYFCDAIKDGRCDQDCNNLDPDCAGGLFQRAIEEECRNYNGIRCAENEFCAAGPVSILSDASICCLESYCRNMQEAGYYELPATDLPEEIKQTTIRKEDGYKEDISTGIKSAGVISGKKSMAYIFAAAIIVIVIIAVFMAYSLRIYLKTKTILNKIEKEIENLHKQGFNYSQIKQDLIRKGYEPRHIDLRIECHYKRLRK